jgi:membrane-bound serine protease (ClpP class)
MIGHIAIARTPLAPTGQVEIRGELWQARLLGEIYLPVGASVRVKSVDGLMLIVDSSQDLV